MAVELSRKFKSLRNRLCRRWAEKIQKRWIAYDNRVDRRIGPGFIVADASAAGASPGAALFDIFLSADYAPFAISFVIMFGVGLIEAIGLGAGQFGVDSDFDGHAGDAALLDWLGIGAGLPILVWLTSLLGCFTLVGIAVQQIATLLLGAPFHWLPAAGIALIAGGVLNGYVAGGLTRLIPSYESTVISIDDLIMRRCTILEGSARRGHPARAKVIDQHKQAHYVMVEPHKDSDVLAQGETGLLVRKDGGTFFIVPDTDTTLRPV